MIPLNLVGNKVCSLQWGTISWLTNINRTETFIDRLKVTEVPLDFVEAEIVMPRKDQLDIVVESLGVPRSMPNHIDGAVFIEFLERLLGFGGAMIIRNKCCCAVARYSIVFDDLGGLL